MFINPKIAIKEGWVTGIVNEEVQVQPNAIDFTLDRLFTVNVNNEFVISEAGKQMRGGTEYPTYQDRKDPSMSFWTLRNPIYDGMSNVYVDLPEGVAAMLVIRSTFNRNGLFLTSGLYDSGYKGHLGFILHNRAAGLTKVARGTRIGQVIFVASGTAKMYAGGWNHDQGTHFAEQD